MHSRFLLPTGVLIVSIVAIYPFKPPAEYPLKSPQAFLNRSRRNLVFADSGTFKYVFGFSQPLNFMDKRPFRHLTLSFSIHVQYALSPRPLYWWSYFTNNTAWATSESVFYPGVSRKHSYNHNPHLKHYGTCVQKEYKRPAIIYDHSRSFVYKALAWLLNMKGLPGARCVFRAICEVAQRPAGGQNLYDRMIDAVFRPIVANIDSKYLHALQVGLKGTDCKRVYWGCSKVIHWLKQLNYYL